MNRFKLFLFLLIGLCLLSCEKFSIIPIQETKYTWIYTKKYCFCGGGTNYYRDTIWPYESTQNISQASFLRNNPKGSAPHTFQFTLNDQLIHIARYDYTEEEDGELNGLSQGSTLYTYYNGTDSNEGISVSSTFWPNENAIELNSIVFDFPFSSNYDHLSDTIIHNYFAIERAE